jgi:hypothetical protein
MVELKSSKYVRKGKLKSKIVRGGVVLFYNNFVRNNIKAV